MGEKIYTIPMNDAFDAGTECPFCLLRRELEKHAIEYTLGPSYMEDDNRAMTDEMGFCPTHIRMLYAEKNRLGVALMLKTHMDKTIREMEKLAEKDTPKAKGLLSRKQTDSALIRYVDKLEQTCFVCSRITPTFARYIDTFFHMWKHDKDFPEKVKASRGFCTEHYRDLYGAAPEKLNQSQLDGFIPVLNQVYFENMKRVNEDVSWFIDKFDYRNRDADWKNSRDALPRGIIKAVHTIVEDGQAK